MVILNKDLVVEVSQSNYTLMLDKHKQDKKGNPVYETLGYYCTLAGAVRGARDYCIKKRLEEHEHSLCEAINEMQKITDEWRDLLHSSVKEKGR